ncbi:uncharacterized protein isoform X6 [Rhodnius prolixus]|uniref:uncharacterized protein isoform X6 n=1 Tax=Rhodnius prolixus TaxID=13249 RepID=UPI003D18AD76
MCNSEEGQWWDYLLTPWTFACRTLTLKDDLMVLFALKNCKSRMRELHKRKAKHGI